MSSNNPNVTNPSLYFPEDVVIDILSRLRVKSIVRFSSVCKTWHAIIKSQSFIIKHAKQSARKPINLVHTDNFYPEEHFISLYYDDALAKPINLDFPFLLEGSNLNIVGVSNGLICVSWPLNECDFVICNPSTRQFNKFSSTDFWTFVTEAAFGFSFDFNSGDYKLVNIVRCYNDDENLVTQEWIYSIGTNIWRETDINVPIDDVTLSNLSPSTIIKGVLYWECFRYERAVILSFDMSDEACGEIEVPQSLKGNWKKSYSMLTQVNQKLAIFEFSYDRGVTLCILNEHSMVWSVKLAIETLPIIATPDMVGETGFIHLVGHGKDGDVIFKHRTSIDVAFFSYNFPSGEIKRLPFDLEGYEHQIYLHTESLFPVKNND